MTTEITMQRPALSICIPTFNRANLLAVALGSITQQAGGLPIEVIVCDNASTDETRSMVEGYSQQYPYVRYFCNSLNIGFDRNLLRAVEHATGTYCWTLGSDDAVAGGALQRILAAITDAPDFILCDAVNCDVHLRPTGILKFLDLPDCLLDFSVASDVVCFLEKATMHASLFGYIGAMVFRRSRFLETSTKRCFIGSGYVHVSRALDMLLNGKGSMRYLAQPSAMARRDNNDDVDGTGGLLRHYTDHQMFRRVADQYFSGDLEIHRKYKAFVRRIYGDAFASDAPTHIDFVDNFRHFFKNETPRLPVVEWQLKPCVIDAKSRLAAAGVLDKAFAPDALLHLGFRGEFDMLARPVNERAIGYDRHYVARFDGVHIPFEDSQFDTIWACHCFDQMQPIAATLQDWFRALKVGGLMVLSCDIGAEVSVAKAPSGGLAPGFSMADLLGLMGEVSETTAYRIVHCLQSLPHIEGSTTVDLMLEKLPSPPVEPTQALLKAMQFHQQGDLSQAQPIYQTILAQHPLHFPALHMLGVVHFQRNELVPAEALLRQALALSERTWEAHYNLGCVLWQSSRFVEARDCFKRCLELNPEYEMAQARLSQLSAAGV